MKVTVFWEVVTFSLEWVTDTADESDDELWG
jgi:hypothetical protein